MRRVLLCVAPALALMVLWTAPAVAHGPCICLDWPLTAPGGEVRITAPGGGQESKRPGYPAYRVMFNPRPSDFGIAPNYLASAYRADVPTTTVLSRPRRQPTRNGRFRVPTGTPPGLYMVLIWDGDEGGAHNTWDYLHVAALDDEDPGEDPSGVVAQQEQSPEPTAGKSPTPQETSGSNTSTPWPLVAGVGLGGLILGVAGSRATRRRRG